ncbi:hypothetical protein F4819DRAFT_305832 [Hypoxylon fuscum]|nr:hypothetical protein F4819DRAFT_305832 [Hypoxylon fuscum]
MQECGTDSSGGISNSSGFPFLFFLVGCDGIFESRKFCEVGCPRRPQKSCQKGPGVLWIGLLATATAQRTKARAPSLALVCFCRDCSVMARKAGIGSSKPMRTLMCSQDSSHEVPEAPSKGTLARKTVSRFVSTSRPRKILDTRLLAPRLDVARRIAQAMRKGIACCCACSVAAHTRGYSGCWTGVWPRWDVPRGEAASERKG